MTRPEPPEHIREWNKMVREAHYRYGSINLSEPEVVVLLCNLAANNALAAQSGAGDPIITEVENYLWWDLCNALSRDQRVGLQKAMVEGGLPLPPHPGDYIERR